MGWGFINGHWVITGRPGRPFGLVYISPLHADWPLDFYDCGSREQAQAVARQFRDLAALPEAPARPPWFAEYGDA